MFSVDTVHGYRCQKPVICYEVLKPRLKKMIRSK